MLKASGVVGNQQDWGQFVTNVDEHETPFLSSLSMGSKPVNVLYSYQADAYTDPSPVAWVDGKDWDTFTSAAANRAELRARVQWFVQTAAVSKLAQDVTNAAGVADELAREIPKKLKEMGRIMEATFCSDQDSSVDDGVTGHKTRGAGMWIRDTAQTDTTTVVPAAYRTPTASIYSGVKASLVENSVRSILESAWGQAGNASVTRKLFLGSQLKSRFTEFSLYVPSSLATQATARVSQRDYNSNRLGYSVDFYDSDFGNLELHLTKWNAHPNFGGSATKAQWRGYVVNPSAWELRYNQKPTVYRPAFAGGSYQAAMDAIAMLVCKSPLCEAKIDPSDA